MKFEAKGGTDFPPVPAGNHVAICRMIVDLGIQPGSGQYPEPKHQVYLGFELPTERIKYEKDGQKKEGPMSIGRTFTASMSVKANLRKFIEGWVGKQFSSDERAATFDIFQLLDKKCLLNVSHKDKDDRTYANIAGASPIPKGMKADFKRENALIGFDLETPDEEMFNILPEWLGEKINKRLEQPKKNGKPAPTETGDFGDSADDIRF
jgi:hypothetical protein